MPRTASPSFLVDITALGGLGDGVATKDGKPWFVPYTVTGDKAEIRTVQTGKQFNRGELVTLHGSGPARRPPACKHFGRCGGCSLQHVEPTLYAGFKRDRLIEAVERAGLDPSAVQPLITVGAGARRRTVLQWHQGALGYYEARSHRICPVEQCPVLEPALESLIPALQRLCLGLPVANALQALALSLTAAGVDMTVMATADAGIEDLERLVNFAKTHDIAAIQWCVNGHSIPVVQQRVPMMQVGEVQITLPSGAFQQATHAGQEAITHIILQAMEEEKQVLDLYAGCGAYSFAILEKALVYAVEGDPQMAATMENAVRRYGKVARMQVECRDLVKRPLPVPMLNRYDMVIMNPPRSGAAAQAALLAKSNVPKLVMVSCNPVTFSADAAVLASGGYRLESATPIDQFTWSNHLELAAVFNRVG